MEEFFFGKDGGRRGLKKKGGVAPRAARVRFDGARRAAAARAGARPSERTRDRRAGAFEMRRVRRWEKELLGAGRWVRDAHTTGSKRTRTASRGPEMTRPVHPMCVFMNKSYETFLNIEPARKMGNARI